ncbi:hypothetical protein CQ020_21575 [Arthrobacter sp. MYb23]|uniref:DUF2264 domain-containing protein n=1 Tax=unclassified Arthrobacter TaxID=235627 RepID=UPI000CFD5929|nr:MULTISPECIES: DUF2264 domain-containing protein [unclassified Arthrobacter]PRB37040.1 hypothetical protein CQ038_20995 [Arthrobacter sp. MYb51]PRB90212.1 hypothetical protein CQ020_21575 [Arthrobacter sp. MYb23]
MATAFTMPAPDFDLSPITGWTREHWVAFADQQLLAVRPYFSPGKATIRLGGRPSSSGVLSDGLEGFARTFLMAAFRVAGERGGDPYGHFEFYREGLLEGTQEGGPEAWPPIRDRSQPMVEAASIVLGLQLTKPWLWDGLSTDQQTQVAAWLQGSSTSTCVDNNWVLFQVMIAEFLAGAGFDHNESQIKHGLNRLEDWYAGGGWYRDGDNDGTGDFFDYYCGWAMHLYPILWAQFAAGRHPEANERLELYRTRLSAFLEDHVRFFGSNGAPVFHGRSLIYRYAAIAPLFMGEAVSATPISTGQTRRIASGAAKYFLDGGAYDGGACDGGLPSLGWLGAFEPMTQEYSGPASPYWTSKAFVGLLLPADHPVWTAVEERSPWETADGLKHAEAPNYLLHSTATDGIFRVLNHGSDKYYAPGPDDPLYRRLAYSSHTAPLFTQDPVDNHFAILNYSETPSRRARIHRLESRNNQAASWHAPIWDGDDPAQSPWKVATGTAVSGGYELRVHVVEAGSGLTVRDGGYALAGASPVSDHHGVLSDGHLHAAIWPLHGYTGGGIHRGEDVSPLGEHAACGYLEGRLSGERSCFASLVYLGGEAPPWVPAAVGPSTVLDVLDDGGRVSARLTLGSGQVLEVSFAF